MLIEIDSGVGAELESLSDAEWSSLDLLARAAGEGKHLLSVNRVLSHSLLSCVDRLSPYSLSIYNRLYKSAATGHPSLLGHLQLSVLVRRGCTPDKQQVSGTYRIILPLEWFSTTDKIQCTNFICENLTDCDVYLALAKKYMSKHSLRMASLHLKCVNGGGHNTGQVLDDALRGRHFTLCIVDSDQDTSRDMPGETARKAIEVFRKGNQPLSELIVIKARELENLLPDVVLEQVWLSVRVELRSRVRHLSRIPNHELRLYANIKSRDITLQDILNYLDQDEDAFSSLVKPDVLPEAQLRCITDQACANATFCQCIILKSLPGDALANSVEVISRTAHVELWSDIHDVHSSELERVLKSIVNWGITSPKFSG
jgi:hypothetical protein